MSAHTLSLYFSENPTRVKMSSKSKKVCLSSTSIFLTLLGLSNYLLISVSGEIQGNAENSNGFSLKSGRNKQKEVLERDGKFIVEWETDFEKELAIFDVTAETTGYVGFGLSPAGGMGGSDIVVGGIFPNGNTYFADYHGVGNEPPRLDEKQDWKLISAFRNSSHTFLRFSRSFDTCDPQDVPLTNDTLNFIWAFGPQEQLSYHHGSRGSVAVNPLDPPYPEKDASELESWKLTVDMVMPNKSFAYWCTIHSNPKINGTGKKHVVGFRPVLNGPLAEKHTHHFVVYKCNTPPGLDPQRLFGPFSDVPGAECYTAESLRQRPTQLCDATLYVWGVGGKEFFLPDHVGYPVGEEKNEYFMLEIHYDNPEQLLDAKFETGVEIFYTSKLRQYDASMMTIGHTVVGSLIIPPKSPKFQIVGHCGSDCTKRAIPETGIKIFNTLLHTHLAGRKMKLRHFRNGTELPWVSYDDSYHFDYQKNRPLREERTILPSDSLTFECTYDTSTRSQITVAGYSTRDEMCETFVWYYPKLHIEGCSSFYPIEKLFQKFGIKDVAWLPGIDAGAQPIVTAPKEMANKTFAQVLTETVNWTPETRQDLQELLIHSDHESVCNVKEPEPPVQQYYTPFNLPPEPPKTMVNYPKVDKWYSPPARCFESNFIPNK